MFNTAPHEINVSISGAGATNDVILEKSFDSFIIIREEIVKLGIIRNHILKETIDFLGMTREFIRGGNPKLLFTMETSLNK